jgi:hypothetical protein
MESGGRSGKSLRRRPGGRRACLRVEPCRSAAGRVTACSKVWVLALPWLRLVVDSDGDHCSPAGLQQSVGSQTSVRPNNSSLTFQALVTC